MHSLGQTLQNLPADHPAKLDYDEWPCGAHTVRGLTYVNGPSSMRELIEFCFKKKSST